MYEISRIEAAEESGAAEVLRKFEGLMAERGMRITDLFRKIDKSGDGLVSRDELREGLTLLSQPCATAVFASGRWPISGFGSLPLSLFQLVAVVQLVR